MNNYNDMHSIKKKNPIHFFVIIFRALKLLIVLIVKTRKNVNIVNAIFYN